MEIFKSVFGDKVVEAYKLYSEYSFYINNETPKIGVKIFVDLNGTYGHSLSHHYKGSRQAGAYTSSNNYCFGDEEAALIGARSEAFSFFDENDEKAEWIPNSMYYLD